MTIKAATGALAAAIAIVLAIPLLFTGGSPHSTSAPGPACGTQGGGDEVAAIAATIRQRESGGDYTARATGSTASGAYQFTDATWAGHAGQPSAWLAPPHVQDAKATDHITGILAANNNDPTAVPVTWYLGYVPGPGDPAWDQVPGIGNTLTPRQYQAAWLADHARRTTTDCTSSPASPDAGVELVTVDGITVNAAIADQVHALVTAAAADGYQLAGGGYRSPDDQIRLRRQNCGTTHYATYQMPSSQCTPPTARPGASNHQQGLAIDLTCNGTTITTRTTACFQWLSDHAPTHGLYNLPDEPWHWSTDGS